MPFSLHNAAKKGDLATLKHLLQEIEKGDRSSDQLEYGDDKDCTPLHHAADNGNIEMMQCLLDAGANIDSITEFGLTPLHMMIHNTQTPLEAVQFLVTKGADLQHLDNSGKNYLHHAFYANRADMVEYFLTLGVNANALDNDGQRPLDRAMDECLEESIKLLRSQRNRHSTLSNFISNSLFQQKDSLEMLVDLQKNYQGRQAALEEHKHSPCLSNEAKEVYENTNWLATFLYRHALKPNITSDELVFNAQKSHTRQALEKHFTNLLPKALPDIYGPNQQLNARL